MPITIVLGSKKFRPSRALLKKWIELENIRNKAIDAVEIGDRDTFCVSLYSYLFTALEIQDLDLSLLPWYEVTIAFDKLVALNSPHLDFPMMKSKMGKEEKMAWDYEGRTFYIWSHLLANAYGWDLNYISNMDIDDAIALTQEILTDQQLSKEWQWSLSEIAYPYNQTTKKSEYKPLPRPDWMMMGETKEPKKVKILKEHIPVGIVVRWSDEGTITQ